MMMKPFMYLLICSAIASCECEIGGHLRGQAEQSKDGRTYLMVVDDNGGGCGSIFFDGHPWPHKMGVAAIVKPGNHQLSCGGTVTFDVPKGTLFKFDYWGP